MLEELLSLARTPEERKLVYQIAGRIREPQQSSGFASAVQHLQSTGVPPYPAPLLGAGAPATAIDAIFVAMSQLINEFETMNRALRRPSRILFVRDVDGQITQAIPEYTNG